VQPMSTHSLDAHQHSTSRETTSRHRARENTRIITPAAAMKVKREPLHVLPESQAVRTAPLRAELHARTAISSLPPPLTTPLANALAPPLPMTLTQGSGLPRPKLAPQRFIELQSRTSTTSSIDQLYFEIGKFKQQFWAKDETEKVAKLGFPVTTLHKRNLWMSSYRVLVGPYRVREEAEAAHRKLISRGFEPRPFERGARDFVLPARLILHGTQAPAGECIIQWESYINTVKVSFRQDNLLLATAEGVWVDRSPKYENSATVYTQNRDGSRILSEIRFEGMNRALVFP
jgi:SPOR domain